MFGLLQVSERPNNQRCQSHARVRVDSRTQSATDRAYGDTSEVLYDYHAERIRLRGIDCPEHGQAFGTRAKQALSALVFGRDVILQTHGQDKYGRTLAVVLLPDGKNLNDELA